MGRLSTKPTSAGGSSGTRTTRPATWSPARTPSDRSSPYEHNELGQIVRKSVDGEVMTYTYDFTDEIAHAGNGHAELTLLP